MACKDGDHDEAHAPLDEAGVKIAAGWAQHLLAQTVAAAAQLNRCPNMIGVAILVDALGEILANMSDDLRSEEFVRFSRSMGRRVAATAAVIRARDAGATDQEMELVRQTMMAPEPPQIQVGDMVIAAAGEEVMQRQALKASGDLKALARAAYADPDAEVTPDLLIKRSLAWFLALTEMTTINTASTCMLIPSTGNLASLALHIAELVKAAGHKRTFDA